MCTVKAIENTVLNSQETSIRRHQKYICVGENWEIVLQL